MSAPGMPAGVPDGAPYEVRVEEDAGNAGSGARA